METVKFDELQLDERIIRAITEMGFEEASPIQAQAIPVAMEGRDMIGQAQTGTGKTAALWSASSSEGGPEGKEASGHCPASYQGAGHPGGGGDAPFCKVHARSEGSAYIRRTGYRKADPLLKGRNTGYRGNSGPCHGPYEKKDYKEWTMSSPWCWMKPMRC